MIEASPPAGAGARLAWLAVVLLAASALAPARAEAIYKCRSDSGSISYGSNPCRAGSRLEERRDYEASAGQAARPAAPVNVEGGAAREPAEEWPRRPSMEEARRHAADEDAARAAATNDRAVTDPRSSLKCIELRRRIGGPSGLTLGHAAAEGCL